MEDHVTPPNLPPGTARLFPEYERHTIAWPEARDLVIGRILASASLRDLRWLRDRVSDGELAGWITRRDARGLDARRLRFLAVILDLPSDRVETWVKRARTGTWDGRAVG